MANRQRDAHLIGNKQTAAEQQIAAREPANLRPAHGQAQHHRRHQVDHRRPAGRPEQLADTAHQPDHGTPQQNRQRSEQGRPVFRHHLSLPSTDCGAPTALIQGGHATASPDGDQCMMAKPPESKTPCTKAGRKHERRAPRKIRTEYRRQNPSAARCTSAGTAPGPVPDCRPVVAG